MAVKMDFEKELGTKYKQLLDAKQQLLVNPNEQGIQWKYAQLEMAYQDTMVKSKLPRNEIETIEANVQEEHDEEMQQIEQFKETYKKDVLKQLEPSKEELDYKDAYKQQVLESLEKEPEEKAESLEEVQNREQEMAAFEQKYGYEKVYELKREVLDEIKEMDLMPVQKEKVNQIEHNLRKEREMKLDNNTKSHEQEMEM